MWDPFSVAQATADQVTDEQVTGDQVTGDQVTDDQPETASSNVETEPEPSAGTVGEPAVDGAPAVDDQPGVEAGIETPSTGAGEPSTQYRADSRADMSVSVFQVHPLVWRHAMDAADGDSRRIEIIDETHVTVHNKRVR